jgi:hypothetical protein
VSKSSENTHTPASAVAQKSFFLPHCHNVIIITVQVLLTCCVITMTTIPFDPPTLLIAERRAGFVDSSEVCPVDSPLCWGSLSSDTAFYSPDEDDDEDAIKALRPTNLKRVATMAGNVVVMKDLEGTQHAYWLQRKIGKTTFGTVRLGFLLKQNTPPKANKKGGGASSVWEVVPHPQDSSSYQMVEIRSMDTSVLEMNVSNHGHDHGELHSNNPLYELSALQMIYKETKGEEHGHVIGTNLIGVCKENVYVILPHHPDGNLFQYCSARASLEEPVARFFFRQIVKVRVWPRSPV